MTKTIGVTGGIGSGKSTVCAILESFGARIFSADEVAKKLMTEDHQVRRELVETFGVDSYTLGGELNVPFLAKTVFTDTDRIARINSIVHPRVFRAFEEAKSMARKDGISLLVLESALLFQTEGHKAVDLNVVVDAPKAVRRARVMERDGSDAATVEMRMKHQLSGASLRRKADLVLLNDGSKEELREAVADLYRKLVSESVSGSN